MNKIPLKTFLDAVEQRLAACSKEELRSLLYSLAQSTQPGERGVFLERIQAMEAEVVAQPPVAENLLDDIADLASEIEEAMEDAEYNEEWEYDEYEDDETDQYDSFYEPLSRLFDRAEAAFDYGDLELARDAYQALFEILDMEDDYGNGISIGALEIDIEEAGARYLRAIYELETIVQRCEMLFDAMLELRSGVFYPRPMLEHIRQISPRPLPDQETFFAEWIAFLTDQPGADADAWLREAVRISQGTTGLEDLARRLGKQHPGAYLDWFSALEQENQYNQVLQAAQEALAGFPQDWSIGAAIADHLCLAAEKLGDTRSLRQGRWQAFKAQPHLSRLLDVWDATPTADRPATMQDAASYLKGYNRPSSERIAEEMYGDEVGGQMSGWVDAALSGYALLLAGDWQTTWRSVAQQNVLGWSGQSKMQGLIVTMFLTLLSGKTTTRLPANLAWLWQDRVNAASGSGYRSDGSFDLALRLDKALSEAIAEFKLSDHQKAQIQSWCLDISRQRIEAIVGAQHRGSYDKAAILTLACTEMLHLRGEAAQANAWLAQIRERFPRHSSFQKELRSATDQMQRSLH